jgi:hypothetical protein
LITESQGSIDPWNQTRRTVNFEEIIEGYEKLRERCYEAGKYGNKNLLGDYYWLRFAIIESDISLEFRENGIRCYGNCYTTQTMSNEFFEFTVPFSELEGE